MKSLRLYLAVLFVVGACAHCCFAQPDQSFPQRFRADGFVFCSEPAKDQSAPIYVGLCTKRQVGTLNCGEKVEVLSRHEDMLTIAFSERPPRRLVPASAISRQPDKFVPFDDQSGIPEGRAPTVRACQEGDRGQMGSSSVPATTSLCRHISTPARIILLERFLAEKRLRL